MCGEFEASALILDNKDIKKVFKRYNNTITDCFEERYASQNKTCEDIDQILVKCSDPENWGCHYLPEYTTTMTQDILEKKLEKFSYNIFWDEIILWADDAIKRSGWLPIYYDWL